MSQQIFGWFLEPGELYDLQLDPQMPVELQQQQQQPEQQPEQQPPPLLSMPQPAQQRQRKQKKRKQGVAAVDRSIQAVQEAAAPLEGQKRSKAKKPKQSSQQGLLQQQQQLEFADVQHTGPQDAAAAGLTVKGARSGTKHRQRQPKVLGASKKAQKHKSVRPRKVLQGVV